MSEIVLGIGALHGLSSTPTEKWDLRARADRENYHRFGPDLTRSVTICNGAKIRNVQHLHLSSPGLKIAEVGNAPPDQGAEYPGAPDLANHILQSLADENFDRSQSSSTPKGSERRRIPHAYGFLYHSDPWRCTSTEHSGRTLQTRGNAMNVEGLKYHIVDHVPCYRSEACTGSGMALGFGG